MSSARPAAAAGSSVPVPLLRPLATAVLSFVLLCSLTACSQGVSPSEYVTTVCRTLSGWDRSLLTGDRRAVARAVTEAGHGDLRTAASYMRGYLDSAQQATRAPHPVSMRPEFRPCEAGGKSAVTSAAPCAE